MRNYEVARIIVDKENFLHTTMLVYGGFYSMSITDMQERFLEVLFDKEVKGDIQKAAKLAGYNAPDKNAWRIARALKDEIIERTKDYLAVHGPQAASAFITALNDGPNVPGVKERLLAAREVLDRSGVIKTEQITIDTPGTLFILPSKDIPQHAKEDG